MSDRDDQPETGSLSFRGKEGMKSAIYRMFIISTRIFLGVIMFSAGMSKLLNGAFPSLIGPVWLSDELGKYGLEYLGGFIAWSQVLIGLLLLTQRFATLGAVMLLPMLLNIFMVMFSLGIHYYQPGEVNSAINTSIINGVLIILNLALLLHDFHKLKFIFYESHEFLRTRKVRRANRFADLAVLGGMMLCLLGPVLFQLSKYLTYAFVIAGILVCMIPLLLKEKGGRRSNW